MKSVLKKIGCRFSDISNDSRHIKNNSLFLAYPGLHNDGRTYIEAAIKKGAKIILYEKKNFVWKKTWSTNHYAVAELKSDGINAVGYKFNVTIEQEVIEAIAKIESEVGGDLHMIRVNGVIVGAFIGLALGVIRAIVENVL